MACPYFGGHGEIFGTCHNESCHNFDKCHFFSLSSSPCLEVDRISLSHSSMKSLGVMGLIAQTRARNETQRSSLQLGAGGGTTPASPAHFSQSAAL